MYMNAKIFTEAHKLAKSIIKAGDSYRATFALCLKFIMSKINWVKSLPLLKFTQGGKRVIQIEVSQKAEFENKTFAKANWGMIEVTGFGKEFEVTEQNGNVFQHKTCVYAYVNEYEF